MSAPVILILDDELAHGRMIEELLAFNEIEADVVGHPQEAFEALRKRNYALVVTDFRMPTMNGVEWMRKAREIVPGLPVMIVSGVMDMPALSQASQSGVNFIFEKPIDIKRFVEQVKQCVMSSKMARPLPRGGPTLPPFKQTAGHVQRGDFPQPLEYLAAQAPAVRTALSALWDRLGEGKPLWLVGPAGSEIEYILKEIAHWQKTSVDAIRVLCATDFKHESVDKLLTQWSRGHFHERIVLWGDLGDMTASDQDAFAGWLDQLQPHFGQVNFVVWVEAELFGAEPQRLSPKLIEIVERSGLYWPPLRKRLADMAAYVARWMQEAHGLDWRLENADILKLVSYDWPKNFCELRLAVESFLKCGHWPDAILKATSGVTSLALKDALLREQSTILASVAQKLHANTSGDVKRVLYIEDDKVLDLGKAERELVYPELV